jgi:hypothetical protein
MYPAEVNRRQTAKVGQGQISHDLLCVSVIQEDVEGLNSRTVILKSSGNSHVFNLVKGSCDVVRSGERLRAARRAL